MLEPPLQHCHGMLAGHVPAGKECSAAMHHGRCAVGMLHSREWGLYRSLGGSWECAVSGTGGQSLSSCSALIQPLNSVAT
jgi:hypothetical protein